MSALSCGHRRTVGPSDVTGATGPDGATAAAAGVSGGPWSLAGVAVGFAAFGVYALARARYPTATRRE